MLKEIGRRMNRAFPGDRELISNSPSKWKVEFAKPRDLDYDAEKKPYIEWRAKDGEDGEDAGIPTKPSREVPEESSVRQFMRGHDESDTCQPQADMVEEFCFGTTLEQLCAKNGEDGPTLPLVAWLDERVIQEGVLRSRPYRGPLTSRDLYYELKKSVSQLLILACVSREQWKRHELY